MRKVYLLLYYVVAQYLPCPPIRFVTCFSKWVRYVLCKRLFKSIGRHVNIQPQVYIGDGSCISLGDYSGLGKRFQVHNTIIQIGCNVLIASDLLVIGGGTGQAV